MPQFQQELLRLVAPDLVWLVMEISQSQLGQMLIPRQQLIALLETDEAMRAAAKITLEGLRTIRPTSDQILWVAQTRNGDATRFGHGRLVLSSLRARSGKEA